MNFNQKRVGIWGFGVVGKAALKLLSQQNASLSVLDKRQLAQSELDLLKKYPARLYPADQLENFLNDHDFILPSPGIDLRPYQQFSQKFISELDIFFLNFKAPIIAITGTVGKTTTTGLLAHTLEQAGYRVCVGGNIGIGMLDLLDGGEPYDYAVLEVSSFQLELSKFFAPHVAVWTNFYPNHLDRHGTMENYFAAKTTMLVHQQKNDFAVLPQELATLLPTNLPAQKIFFGGKGAQLTPAALPPDLPQVTYQQNLVAIAAALTALNVPLEVLTKAAATFTVHEHRLEKVATINGVDFYNDSKSTIAQATIAAVEKLQGKPVILLLGGLSKGVDRSSLFEQIRGKVSAIFCFGKEAEHLHALGTAADISCYHFETLETALAAAIQKANAGDQILFSPAGSSFDLFSNYQERGTIFKKLVASVGQQ